MENWDAALLGIGHLVWFWCGLAWSGLVTVRYGAGELGERVGRELAVSKNGQEWANDRNGGGWGFSSLTLHTLLHTVLSSPPGVALFSLFSSLASCSLLACCCSCSSPSSSSYHHIISIS